MNIAYKPPIPATFLGSRVIKLESEVNTRKGAKIWSKAALGKLTQLRALNLSYIECAELLDCNVKAVRRAVLIHKLQAGIDNLRSNLVSEAII